MADFPALPLWTDAYLSDLHPRLTLEQHGCMILLMQFAWRTPSCSLPDDDGLMARMLGITEHRWKQKLKPVIGSLWTVANGQWTNKRLTKERKYVEQNVEQRRAAGRASALKRKETVPTAVQLPTPTPTEEEDSVSNETEGAREIQPKVKNGVRGIRLPLDWQPSADDRRFAAGLGLAPDKTGDIFRDYWLAQP